MVFPSCWPFHYLFLPSAKRYMNTTTTKGYCQKNNCQVSTNPSSPTPDYKGAKGVPKFSKTPISGTSKLFYPYHRLFKHFPTPFLGVSGVWDPPFLGDSSIFLNIVFVPLLIKYVCYNKASIIRQNIYCIFT
jgi:hypothetical protein